LLQQVEEQDRWKQRQKELCKQNNTARPLPGFLPSEECRLVNKSTPLDIHVLPLCTQVQRMLKKHEVVLDEGVVRKKARNAEERTRLTAAYQRHRLHPEYLQAIAQDMPGVVTVQQVASTVHAMHRTPACNFPAQVNRTSSWHPTSTGHLSGSHSLVHLMQQTCRMCLA
jgi:hypothetical protein